MESKFRHDIFEVFVGAMLTIVDTINVIFNEPLVV